jgi:DNA-binding transcriptional regulator YiaG
VRFGIRPLTAKLLVARRPLSDITQIRSTLGLTPEQFSALVGS